VIAVGDDAGRVTYTKADEFPEHPENGIGSDVHNAYLADRSREEQADKDRADEQAWRASPQARTLEETATCVASEPRTSSVLLAD
jgi:hypothetical protein